MVGVASKYPGGFEHGVAIREMPVLNSYGGNIFWVDSGSGSDATGSGTYNKPFATLDYAIGRCTASNGDLILLKPGHAENVTTHDGIDLDIAGVEVVGLGQGRLRPTFTWSGTDATASFTIGAANTSIRNLVFVCNDTGNDVASAVQIGADTTGINDVTVDSCEFDNGTGSFLVGVLIQDGQNRATVSRCKFLMVTGTSSDSAVSMTATATAVEGHAFVDNWIHGDFDEGAIDLVDDTAAVTGILIKNNYIRNERAAGYAIDLDSAGSATNVTGLIAHNYVATSSAATAIYYGGADLMDNQYGLDNLSQPTIAPGAQLRAVKGDVEFTTDDEVFEVDGGSVIINGMSLAVGVVSEEGAGVVFDDLHDEVGISSYFTDSTQELEVDNLVAAVTDSIHVSANAVQISEAGDLGSDTPLRGMAWVLPTAAAVAWVGAGSTVGSGMLSIDYTSLGGVLEIE